MRQYWLSYNYLLLFDKNSGEAKGHKVFFELLVMGELQQRDVNLMGLGTFSFNYSKSRYLKKNLRKITYSAVAVIKVQEGSFNDSIQFPASCVQVSICCLHNLNIVRLVTFSSECRCLA